MIKLPVNDGWTWPCVSISKNSCSSLLNPWKPLMTPYTHTSGFISMLPQFSSLQLWTLVDYLIEPRKIALHSMGRRRFVLNME